MWPGVRARGGTVRAGSRSFSAHQEMVHRVLGRIEHGVHSGSHPAAVPLWSKVHTSHAFHSGMMDPILEPPAKLNERVAP